MNNWPEFFFFCIILLILNFSLFSQDKDDDESDIPQSLAYTVIDINSISLRKNKGNKSSELRRSRSVEHLYDVAGGIGIEESTRRKSPSPFVRSPSIPEAVDDLSSHIYASVDKTLKNKRKEDKEEEEREEDEPEEEEYEEDDENKVDQNEALHDEIDKLDSPPPVPPFNGHVYAVVSKNGPGVEPTKTDITPKANKRAPPPIPAPYSQNSSPESPRTVTTPTETNIPKIVTPPTDTEVATVTTQAANKYSHLLKKKLPPPSHTPPPPPPFNNGTASSKPDENSTNNLTTTPSLIKPHLTASIDIMKRARHDYEQIDFDELASHSPFSSSCSPNLSSSLPSSTPPMFSAPPTASLTATPTSSLSVMPNKRAANSKTLPPPHRLRELKPKDRPAPPPPFSKKSKDDSKLSSTTAIVSQWSTCTCITVICVHIYMYMYMCTCTCTCVHVHVYVHVHVLL